MRVSRSTVANGLILAFSVSIALATADWVLGRYKLGHRYFEALRQGVSFDTRSRLEFVLDQRRVGRPNWFLPVSPVHFPPSDPLLVDGQRVLPLGNVANAHIAGCNEGGFHSSFRTDRFGFRNAGDRWDDARLRLDFIVGDSFAEGDCVDEGGSVAEQLGAKGRAVVNLARRGSGPLMMLAAIREFVRAGGVDRVYWLHCEENDLTDIEFERQDPILVRYLDDPAFEQALVQRQAEVNRVLAAHVEGQIQAGVRDRRLVLPHLRAAIVQQWRAAKAAGRATPAERVWRVDLALFERALTAARDEVRAKGGDLVFVYLPHHGRIAGAPLSLSALHRSDVLARVGRLGIASIDVEPLMLEFADPARRFFPLGLNGHYNAAGYRLVADTIAAQPVR